MSIIKLANKIVIALYGRSNIGKTATLKKVIDKLGRKYKVNDARETLSTANDKLVIVDIDGVKVGISTGGDEKNMIKGCITKLFNKGCNIIVTATRSRCAPVEVVEEFCETNNYKLDWVKKSSTVSKEISLEELNKRNNKYNEIDSEIILDAIFYHLR